VIAPRHTTGLPDERARFTDALRHPIGSAPLASLVGPRERVAVVIPDLTRPFPSARVLPWLFEELPHVSPANVVILLGNGSHRAATGAEIASLVGPEIAGAFRVINHNAYEPAAVVSAGRTPDGRDVTMNRMYLEADRPSGRRKTASRCS
jgi:nickel-dependent lactate racemase